MPPILYHVALARQKAAALSHRFFSPFLPPYTKRNWSHTKVAECPSRASGGSPLILMSAHARGVALGSRV